MNDLTERQLMTRAAWLYYVGGLNQEAASARLGLTRARVNKLLAQAREIGLVSITINDRDVGMLPVAEALRREFGLELCIATPAIELPPGPGLEGYPMRAVGAAAAQLLRQELQQRSELVVGTGWGRTLAQMARQMSGLSAPKARFTSLMGSLTANSAVNPFEVVQSLALATGGEGYFLPVPFIADNTADRDTLIAQRAVARPLELARYADLALISVGEMREGSLLRQSGMISADELSELRAAGAVGDTNGLFFDAKGQLVDHPLARRTIAVGFQDLRRARTIVLAAGLDKVPATLALLRSGIAKGLIIDGDTALALQKEAGL
ncbi:MAG: sugar-binding transcriptional regulator [Pseudomonadota bacterium]